jgi:hypothetical protein
MARELVLLKMKEVGTMKVMSLHPDTERESRCSKLKNKKLSMKSKTCFVFFLSSSSSFLYFSCSISPVLFWIRHYGICYGHRIQNKKAHVAEDVE